MPGCPDLAMLADQAAGQDDRYEGACDDELIGVLCAWDRLEAHMAARKLAAFAELIRRRPDKARKRREAAARDARVQRWAEDSGTPRSWAASSLRPRCSLPTSGSARGRGS
jgi:hypothetical protein